MIIDSRTLPHQATITADVCIVGAGTAGMALAHGLMDRKLRVCLLEGGGPEPDRRTQSLYWGENLGLPYYPLDTARARYFGGSTNRWHVDTGNNDLGARMRPLDEIDFEEREGFPYSGWPFRKSHLDPYYERADHLLRIGPYSYEVSDWNHPGEMPLLPFQNDKVASVIFKIGSRKPLLHDCRDEIEHAENIEIFTYANVLNIETDETAQTVSCLHAGSLEGGRFRVSARAFILAAGGIETPRLLLLSNKVMSCGLGNQHDLVGRCFMEHLHLWSGVLVPRDPEMIRATALYNSVHRVRGVPVIGKLALREQVLKEERLLNGCIQLIPRIVLRPEVLSLLERENTTDGSGGSGAFGARIHQRTAGWFRKISRDRTTIYRIANMCEQVPNMQSRVKLGAEPDALGLRRAQLDWNITERDILSIMRMQEILQEEIRNSGLGSLIIQLKDATKPPAGLHGGYHHMGTTRMHQDPKQGVVDGQCRVHGISNLFIAGPSVFPTGGYANPVLTVVALALRLADHIKRAMER